MGHSGTHGITANIDTLLCTPMRLRFSKAVWNVLRWADLFVTVSLALHKTCSSTQNVPIMLCGDCNQTCVRSYWFSSSVSSIQPFICEVKLQPLGVKRKAAAAEGEQHLQPHLDWSGESVTLTALLHCRHSACTIAVNLKRNSSQNTKWMKYSINHCETLIVETEEIHLCKLLWTKIWKQIKG